MCIHDEEFVNVVLHAKKKRQYMYDRNIEARSRNHCCRREAMSITYSECVLCSLSYPARKAHASYDIIICGLSGSTISYKRHDFGGKKYVIEHKMCVWFSLQLLSETFLGLQRTEPDTIIKLLGSPCKLHVINVRLSEIWS